MARLGVALLVLSLAACGGVTRHKPDASALVGQSRAALLETWGEPDTSETVPGAGQRLIYEDDAVTYQKTSAPWRRLTVECRTAFVVGADDRISSYTEEGRRCGD